MCKNERTHVFIARAAYSSEDILMGRAQDIKDKALRLGFSKCGMIGVDSVKGYRERIDQRVAAFPQSALMYYQFAHFADVRQKFPWARSLVVCVHDHGKYKIPDSLKGRIGSAYMFDGRKDKNADVHIAREELMKFIEGMGIKVGRDTEHGVTSFRYAAEKAGLGKLRRNNFFYTENGSSNSIEVFAIDEELELIEKNDVKECPDDCDRCAKACPTGSLTSAYKMHPMKCVSFMTSIGGNLVNLVDNDLSKGIGNWIYGCDECQDACPFNQGRPPGDIEFPGLREISDKLSLEQIIDMDNDFYVNVLQPKFWYIRPDNVWVWKVNALNAMKNDYQQKYEKYIKKCMNDENERISDMAKWVCEVLNI